MFWQASHVWHARAEISAFKDDVREVQAFDHFTARDIQKTRGDVQTEHLLAARRKWLQPSPASAAEINGEIVASTVHPKGAKNHTMLIRSESIMNVVPVLCGILPILYVGLPRKLDHGSCSDPGERTIECEPTHGRYGYSFWNS